MNPTLKFGKRKLTEWLLAPEMNVSIIQKRQNLVKFFSENSHISNDLVENLMTFEGKKLPDIPALLQKIKMISREGLPEDHPSTRANIYNVEQYAKRNIKQFCTILNLIDYLWKNIVRIKESDWFDDSLPELLQEIFNQNMPDLSEDVHYWSKAFNRNHAIETGKIKPKKGSLEIYDQALEQAALSKETLNQYRQKIAEKLNIFETGKKLDELVPYFHKPKFPYLLDFNAKYEKKLIDLGFNVHSSKKATKTKAGRVIVIKKPDHFSLAEKTKALEDECEKILREKVTNEIYIHWVKSAHKWLKLTECLQLLDCLLSLSAYVNSESEIEFCTPEFLEGEENLLEMVDSKHPCIKLPAGQTFVKNSICMNSEKGKVMILKAGFVRSVAGVFIAFFDHFSEASSK